MKSSIVTVNVTSTGDATPVALMVQAAGKYNSKIYFQSGTKHINAKSIMGMMSLILNEGDEVTITTEGDDEDAAMDEMVRKLTTGR
jgi:phosphotransferase system HPr (HPr) family protein